MVLGYIFFILVALFFILCVIDCAVVSSTFLLALLLAVVPLLVVIIFAPILAKINQKNYMIERSYQRKKDEEALEAAKKEDKNYQILYETELKADKYKRETVYTATRNAKWEQFCEIYKTYQQQLQYLASVNVLGSNGIEQSSSYIGNLISCIENRQADSIKEAVNKLHNDAVRRLENDRRNQEMQELNNRLMAEAARATDQAYRARQAAEQRAEEAKKAREELERHNREIENILKYN